MMRELRNRICLSVVSLVERLGLLISRFLALRCSTVCAFADLGVSSMMCGTTLIGTSVDSARGLMICGSAPGVFRLVERW